MFYNNIGSSSCFQEIFMKWLQNSIACVESPESHRRDLMFCSVTVLLCYSIAWKGFKRCKGGTRKMTSRKKKKKCVMYCSHRKKVFETTKNNRYRRSSTIHRKLQKKNTLTISYNIICIKMMQAHISRVYISDFIEIITDYWLLWICKETENKLNKKND